MRPRVPSEGLLSLLPVCLEVSGHGRLPRCAGSADGHVQHPANVFSAPDTPVPVSPLYPFPLIPDDDK